MAEVKEWVELYLYSSSGPSWAVTGWTLLHFESLALANIQRTAQYITAKLQVGLLVQFLVYDVNRNWDMLTVLVTLSYINDHNELFICFSSFRPHTKTLTAISVHFATFGVNVPKTITKIKRKDGRSYPVLVFHDVSLNKEVKEDKLNCKQINKI
jgi:hypothetical protein